MTLRVFCNPGDIRKRLSIDEYLSFFYSPNFIKFIVNRFSSLLLTPSPATSPPDLSSAGAWKRGLTPIPV